MGAFVKDLHLTVHYQLEKGNHWLPIIFPSIVNLKKNFSRTLHSTRPNPAIGHNGALSEIGIDPNEPKYCYCNQVSFGDMVACDGENVSTNVFGND